MEQLNRNNYYDGIMIGKGLLGQVNLGKVEEISIEHNEAILKQDIEYTDFLCFLLEQNEAGNELVVIESIEYDRFYKSTYEDDEMDMLMLDCESFFEQFEEMIGIKAFKSCFVSAKYIDELENRMILVVKIDGINKEFIIDVA
jgi:hypothetical protein